MTWSTTPERNIMFYQGLGFLALSIASFIAMETVTETGFFGPASTELSPEQISELKLLAVQERFLFGALGAASGLLALCNFFIGSYGRDDQMKPLFFERITR